MKKGFITRKEYMEVNEVSHKTAHAGLKEMAEKGFSEEKEKVEELGIM